MQSRPSGQRHTLTHDAERYLEQVRSTLVSIKDRERHIGAWLPKFGHLQTLSLPDHTRWLNEQLREWRKTLSASTCNLRRDALTNLVKVLYGRRAAAEFVDLVRFQTPPPTPRWIDRTHISEVLQALPSETKTHARLALMHWTGMRRHRWDDSRNRTSACTSRFPSSRRRAASEEGSQQFLWLVEDWMRHGSSSAETPSANGPAQARTRPSHERQPAWTANGSPSTRSGTRSRQP